jgi:tRNA(adenine34) deaminase
MSPATLTPDWVFTDTDRRLMGIALEHAARAASWDDVPVGVVVADADYNVLAVAGNQRERCADPTAHAEIVALREAGHQRGTWRLDGCSLYVTVEPCAMCAAACALARLSCVIWGAPDPKAGFVGSLGNLLEDGRLNHQVAWRGGLCADEAGALVSQFFAKLRGQR